MANPGPDPTPDTMDAAQDNLLLALAAFPEDDERHWEVQAYLFNLLAHKAASRADAIRAAKRKHIAGCGSGA